MTWAAPAAPWSIRAARRWTASISWWHGDDDYDDAVGSNDGLTAGGVTFAAGVDHDGFNFNGTTGSFVEVPDDATLSPSELTIDAWINAPVLGGRIVDKIAPGGNDGYLLDIIGDHLRVIVGNDSMASPRRSPRGCSCTSRWSTPARA